MTIGRDFYVEERKNYRLHRGMGAAAKKLNGCGAALILIAIECCN
jgi:hypothetical protein